MPVDTSAPLRDIVDEYKNKNADELYGELGKIPFFMNEYNEGEEENPQVEALRAMAYEGEPWEIAENFRQQGNDCFKAKKYKDAVQFYTQALDQKTERQDINIACLGNRAQCNLELKNYRRCITDCTRVLDLDAENIKAWYRSAKAFMLLDKVDESLACCDRGLAVSADNATLLSIKTQAEQRKVRLQELAAAEQQRKEEADLRQRTLQLAMGARGLVSKYTITNRDSSNPGNLRVNLEDPKDANSTLYMPVLALYPLAMESDILQQVDESVQLGEIADQLFAELPKWADPNLYSSSNVELYVQTASGGLAKVGRKTMLGKAFGTAGVVMVDNMARIYMVPKQESAQWIANWNKDAQAKLLRD